MKIVYVVTGSDDGLLSVHGNKKGAYADALKYVNDGNYRDENLKIMSYSKVCKELKDVYNYSIELCDYYSRINATISALAYNPK